MSCRIVNDQISGWRALRLSNRMIEVTVLPEKGADIYSFVDVASCIDVLMKTPWGLQPPGAAPRPGSGLDKFLQNYEGAWQELFPNTGPSCAYLGHAIPLHGEVATLPWDVAVERDDEAAICVRLDVACREFPLSLTRYMTLTRDSPKLIISERVRNLSEQRISFVWGHHPVLGAPFLEKGCRVEVSNGTVCTPAIPFDPAKFSYACAQRRPWPIIDAVDGRKVDLRVIPGPDADTHDHACITEFDRGMMQVENSRLGLVFTMEWDAGLFRWINNWRPFGGSHAPPLEGIYGFAVEPWSTHSNLADALSDGTALSLESHETLDTSLSATLRNTNTTDIG